MRAIDRRGMLARIALMAIAPALCSARAAQAQASAFKAPRGPMLFTRRLLRELQDGEAIAVTRGFAIRFLRDGAGYRVEGSQSFAHVTAPETLAGLARLEEQRRETGLFPMRLDATGRIVAGPPDAPPADLTQALDEAFAWISRQPMSGAERGTAREFVAGLQTVAARLTTVVPPDLFTGQSAPVETSRDLPMPDGRPGTLSLSYSAIPGPTGGLLARAQRIVTTQAAGTRMRSIEEWTLEPLRSDLGR